MANIRNAEYKGYTAESIANSLEQERQALRKARVKGDRIAERIALVNINCLMDISEQLTKLRSAPKPKDKPINTSTARKQQNVHEYGDDSKSDTLRRVMKSK